MHMSFRDYEKKQFEKEGLTGEALKIAVDFNLPVLPDFMKNYILEIVALPLEGEETPPSWAIQKWKLLTELNHSDLVFPRENWAEGIGFTPAWMAALAEAVMRNKEEKIKIFFPLICIPQNTIYSIFITEMLSVSDIIRNGGKSSVDLLHKIFETSLHSRMDNFTFTVSTVVVEVNGTLPIIGQVYNAVKAEYDKEHK